MLVWKIFVFTLILGNCEAKCSKNGWKKIKKTIKDCIDKYVEDMKGDSFDSEILLFLKILNYF